MVVYEKINRKGLFAITSMMILAVVIAIALISFLASPSIRFTLIGIALIAGIIIYVIPATLSGDFTGNKIAFIIILFLIAIVIMFLPEFGLFQQTGFSSDTHFEAPFYSTISCDPAGSRIDSNPIDPTKVGNWIECPVNSIDCDISYTYPDLGADFFTLKRRMEYYQCNDKKFNGCETPRYITDIEDNGGRVESIGKTLPSGKVLYVEFQKIKIPFGWEGDDANRGRIFYNYQPYALFKQNSLRGGRTRVDSGSLDCKVPTSSTNWIQRILSSTVLDNEGQTADTSFRSCGSNQNQLCPNEAYNYISGTVTRATFGNNVDYQGQQGYCVQNQGQSQSTIYGFGKITTPQTTYSVVDVNNPIASVECCELGRIELGRICRDFKYEEVVIEEDGTTDVQCSITLPCPPGTLALNDDQSFEWQCVQGFCQQTNIKDVQCITNNQCGNNQVCENFICTQASTIPGSTNEDNLDQDGNLECPFYQTPAIINSEDCGFLGLKGAFGQCEQRVTNTCRTNPVFILVIILGVGVLIVMTLLISSNRKSKKKGRK